MGGEQAARVLDQIRRDAMAARGEASDGKAEKARIEEIREQYEIQGHPYYASARLWDDDVIEPAQTRDVLGRCLDVVLRPPIPATRFGTFRM
jgi:3-methylcrotonyl-CoA carboxylase beta subunit